VQLFFPGGRPAMFSFVATSKNKYWICSFFEFPLETRVRAVRHLPEKCYPRA
jgi:hypothetical protein